MIQFLNIFLRFILLSCLSLYGSVVNAEISGAGSSLAYPVMKELSSQYQAQRKVEVKYNPVGSGQGIVQMAARAVDFSLSDIPLTQYELSTQNLVQFPVFASAIVPVLNLPGLEKKSLLLDGSTLADIYLGRVTQWNDKTIQALNPTLSLPPLPITVIYRADISGSSYVFTRFLSKSSVHWNTQYGIGSKLKWPVGVGAKGSLGMQELIQSTPGSLGYLEYGAANTASLAIANLLVGGNTIVANPNTFAQTFDTLGPVRPSFYQFSTPKNSLAGWPIVAVTYALVSKKPNSDDAVLESLNFFSWVYQNGASTMKSFQLLPVESKKTLSAIEAQWRTITNQAGRSIWSGAGVDR